MLRSPSRSSVRSGYGWPLRLLATVLAFGLFAGCAPQSADHLAAERSQVLGTWAYQTDGIQSLQRGTLRITMQDGNLTAQLRDTWRGSLRAHVDLHGSRMELKLRQVRITGRLEHDRFRGTVRTSFWDASQEQDQPQSSGIFVARRVQSQAVMNDLTELGCASLLRESSYACSPLQHP